MSGSVDTGMQNGATESNLCSVCSVACVLFFPCHFNLPPTTILHPVCNNVSDIFLQDCCNLEKAKIKRRLLGYSLTCVLLYDITREEEKQTPGSFWQNLICCVMRCNGVPWLQYHVWIGVNILIVYFNLNTHNLEETWSSHICHNDKWLAKTSTS